MKIATWNVNSVRKRTVNLVGWLKSAKPDVVVLQELKAQEAQFPRLEVEAAGYKVEMVGQKAFNGVALLSLHPVEITARSLPDPEPDEPARYIEGKIQTPKGPLTVGGLYLPNGNPIGTEKFAYKIAWMDRLIQRARQLLDREEMFVLGGGCSGFQYNFSFEDQRNDDDLVIERDGAAVLVDATSLELLKGSELDYVEEMVGSSFQVKNPNATSSCGCGNSFSV